MTYDEFMDIVLASSVDDWNIISCWGYGSGPSYKSKFDFYEVWEGGKGILREESHGMYAVYKQNISISMAFGLTVNEDFKEKWANSFSDPQASSHILDLFMANTLIDRIVYVDVDGGRAKLPFPESTTDLLVDNNEYKLIKLIDAMESDSRNFEKYFEIANLRIRN